MRIRPDDLAVRLLVAAAPLAAGPTALLAQEAPLRPDDPGVGAPGPVAPGIMTWWWAILVVVAIAAILAFAVRRRRGTPPRRGGPPSA